MVLRSRRGQGRNRGSTGAADCTAKEPRNRHRNTLDNSMNLELDVNEINFILQTLGELPSKSGVWPLIVKVKEQAEAQVPKAKDEP